MKNISQTISYIIFLFLQITLISNLQGQTKKVEGKIMNYQPDMSKAVVHIRLTNGDILSSKVDEKGAFSFDIPKTFSVQTFVINPVSKFELTGTQDLSDGNYLLKVKTKDNKILSKNPSHEENILVKRKPQDNDKNKDTENFIVKQKNKTLQKSKKEENDKKTTAKKQEEDIQEEAGVDLGELAEDNVSDNEDVEENNTVSKKQAKKTKKSSNFNEIKDELNKQDETISRALKELAGIENSMNRTRKLLDNPNLSKEEKDKLREQLSDLEKKLRELLERYQKIHENVKELAGIQESFIARYSRYLLTMLLALIVLVFLAYYFFVVARRERKRKEQIAEQKEELIQQAEELQQLTEEITTQRDALEGQKEYLEQLQTSKEKLTRSVVHDLKNPLGAVLTSDNFDEIHEAGRRMESYIADMLNIQKYSETGFPVTIQDNSLYQSAQNAINTLRPVASKKGVKIFNKVEPSTFAKFDVKSIERTFENFLSNAIKYTPSGGEITVDAQLKGENYKVLVKDTGIGIAKDKFEEIFEPFMQLEARQFASISSTGIGLTFCKMAVEAHNSKIQVSSNEGQGSEFAFELKQGQAPENFVAKDMIMPIEETDLQIDLSKEDKVFLEKYVKEIKKIAWFKTKQLSTAISEIPENNENIKIWKNKLLETCENRNKAGFKELLNNIN